MQNKAPTPPQKIQMVYGQSEEKQIDNDAFQFSKEGIGKLYTPNIEGDETLNDDARSPMMAYAQAKEHDDEEKNLELNDTQNDDDAPTIDIGKSIDIYVSSDKEEHKDDINPPQVLSTLTNNSGEQVPNAPSAPKSSYDDEIKIPNAPAPPKNESIIPDAPPPPNNTYSNIDENDDEKDDTIKRPLSILDPDEEVLDAMFSEDSHHD